MSKIRRWSWLALGALVALHAFAQGAQDTTSQSVPEALRPTSESDDVSAQRSVAGRWYSAFGYLDLEQEGHTFSGTYSCCKGTIEGTVVEKQVDFTWKDPIYGAGWGTFKLRDNDTKLVGVWGEEEDFGSRGTWNAERLVEPEISGTVSHFAVEVEHPTFGPFEGMMTIGIDGETVTGKLEGFFETPAKDGLFYRDEVYFPILGKVEDGRLILEWEDPRNDELGGLEMEREGEGWAGEWEAHRTDRRVPMTWNAHPPA